MFHRCQRSIHNIGNRGRGGSQQEQKVTRNVMGSLAASLQDLSVTFRQTQSSYLKRKKEKSPEKAKAFFFV